MSNPLLKNSRRWVVKVGSSLLSGPQQGLNLPMVERLVRQLAQLHRSHSLFLVSSGAVAAGMARLDLPRRPSALQDLQALAAVGQMRLSQAYETQFQRHGIITAQVLLTHHDLVNRRHYLNARSTLRTLMHRRILPVINENDAVAVDELRFGDNDNLAALVTNLIEADLLVIVTDQQGLFNADPRRFPNAERIAEAAVDDATLDACAAPGAGDLGRGGMQSKLAAARRAARSGAQTVILSGHQDDGLLALADGVVPGTLLRSRQAPLAARKQWLANQMQARGRLWLDDGATLKLTHAGKSLLAIGVTAVKGDFQRGDLVLCLNQQGHEVARGLANYSAAEADRIKRLPSNKFKSVLGYLGETELIHRDNMVLSGDGAPISGAKKPQEAS